MITFRLWHIFVRCNYSHELVHYFAPSRHKPEESMSYPQMVFLTFVITGFAFIVQRISQANSWSGLPAIAGVVLIPGTVILSLIAFSAAIVSPLFALSGMWQGIRLTLKTIDTLTHHTNIQHRENIQLSPQGFKGLLRSIGTAQLRTTQSFMNIGIYRWTELHLIYAIGIGVMFGIMATLNLAQVTQFSSLPDEIWLQISMLILLDMFAFIALIHFDYRQYVMFGITLGFLSGIVFKQRILAQIVAITMFVLAGIVPTIAIFILGFFDYSIPIVFMDSFMSARRLYSRISMIDSILGIGWGVFIIRELVIYLAWRFIFLETGFSLHNFASE